MPYSVSDLEILGLTPPDLDNLSAEEQSKKLRKQWYKLSLQYHPDRQPGYESQFQEITSAYNRLTASDPNHYQHDITHYFTAQDVDIPDTAFDLTQQEGIHLSYEDLLHQFSNLPSEHVKQKFAQYYAPFLNLAISLEKQQEELNHKRAENFYAQTQEQFSQRLTREWRLLVLRIFAEEYLDDFLYRHALSTGEIWPILATRKLVNPLKGLICIVNGLLLLTVHGGAYLIEIISLQVIKDFFMVYSNPNRNWYATAKVGAKLLALSIISVLPFYLMPSIAFYLMSLPFLRRCLEIIASPISQYIRPCSKRLACSEKKLSIVSLIGASTAIVWCAFHTSMILASLPMILSILNILISLYMLYSLAKLIKTLYQIQPAIAIFQVLLILGGILFQLAFPLPASVTAPTLANLFGEFLLNLSTCTILEIVNSQLADMSAYQGELMEILPLPTEPIQPELKKACLLGYQKATWSHRLFQTPKDAPSLSIEEAHATNTAWAYLWGRERPSEQNAQFTEEHLLLR